MDWLKQMGLALASLMAAGVVMSVLENALGIASIDQTRTIVGVAIGLLLARGIYLALERRRSPRRLR